MATEPDKENNTHGVGEGQLKKIDFKINDL
jgi:hypothetical protein